MKKNNNSKTIKEIQKYINSLVKDKDLAKKGITTAQLELFETSVNEVLSMKYEIKSLKQTLKKKKTDFEKEMDKIIDFYKTTRKTISKNKPKNKTKEAKEHNNKPEVKKS
jgi:hypothetical protein